MLRTVSVRHGVRASPPCSTWVLTAGIPGTTTKASAVGLARYSYTPVVSRAFRGAFSEMYPRLINVASRHCRSGRQPILNIAAGLPVAPNLSIRHCVLIVDRTLWAFRTCFRDAIMGRSGGVYGLADVEVRQGTLQVHGPLGPRGGTRGIREFDIEEVWVFDVLACEPGLMGRREVNTICHGELYTDEMGRRMSCNTDPELWDTTYSFQQTTRWEDIGAQCPGRIGWRPDCAKPRPLFSERGVATKIPTPLLRRRLACRR